MPEVVAVGFSVRALAQSVVNAGFDVASYDRCGDRDLIALSHSHSEWTPSVLDEIQTKLRSGATLLLGGGTEHDDPLLSQLGEMGERVRSMRSLENWEKWAHQSGLHWPETIHRSACDNLSKPPVEQVEHSGDAWLEKSYASAGGLGTRDWEWDRWSDWWNENSHRATTYLQRKIPGNVIGVTFISSQHGTCVLGCSQALQGTSMWLPTPYAYAGSIAPFFLDECKWQQLDSFGRCVQSQTNWIGLWQADLVDGEAGLFLLEINPRWSGSMDLIDVVQDVRLVALHRACLRREVTNDEFHDWQHQSRIACLRQPQTWIGKRIVYAERAMVVTQDQAEHWWQRRWQGHLPELMAYDSRVQLAYSDIPWLGTQIEIGHPILTCMRAAVNREQLWSELTKVGTLSISSILER